jgi:uncharacterized phage protein (TIGR01671 family)
MREILFRAKKSDADEWVEGCICRDKNWMMVSHNPRRNYHIIPDTVGQYTGLKDKNSVKIFEGDIVEYKTMHLLVRFAEKYGCFTVDDKFWMSAHNEFRIIGNIHDYPELLNWGKPEDEDDEE